MHTLNIGIVGGSIAGCSAAILLGRMGHDVQVFERSRGNLVGRGGGIGTSTQVFQSLIDQDVIDADFPHTTCSMMPFIIRTPEHLQEGYIPWSIPIGLEGFQWSALWHNLRKRVPDERYHQGERVIHGRPSASGVELEFEGGGKRAFDFVVFADGYQSLGRSLLFPEAQLDYRGYVLWRGLLPEREMSHAEPLDTNCPRISYANEQGNYVAYFIPDDNGDTSRGKRLLNWAAYIVLPESDVSNFMIDKDGIRHSGSIPPGSMRQETEEQLRKRMVDNLPTYYGNIVAESRNTYAQLIYTVQLPAYRKDRMCLIGDAGTVAQPFTGSGVFKGYNNIVDLVKAMESHPSLEDALQAWDAGQTRIGNRLVALGQQMETAFIRSDFDLSSADEESTRQWWKAAVTFPEEFTYEAK